MRPFPSLPSSTPQYLRTASKVFFIQSSLYEAVLGPTFPSAVRNRPRPAVPLQTRHVAPARPAPRRGVPLPRRCHRPRRGRGADVLGLLRADHRPRHHLGVRHRARGAAAVPRLLLGGQGWRGVPAVCLSSADARARDNAASLVVGVIGFLGLLISHSRSKMSTTSSSLSNLAPLLLLFFSLLSSPSSLSPLAPVKSLGAVRICPHPLIYLG